MCRVGSPGMGRLRSRGFAIAGDRIKPQPDTWCEHKPVVGKLVAGRERNAAGLGIDRGRIGDFYRDASAGYLVVPELLAGKITQTAEYGITHRWCGVGGAGFNQRDRDFRIGSTKRSGAACAGKTASDDNYARGSLRP